MNKPTIPLPLTVKHGAESEHVNDIGGIPPYEISAWAEGKSVDELHTELERRKDVARVEGQLLDHEWTTLEWIAAEARQLRRRSAADIAADPTPEERAAISDALTAYYVTVGEHKDAVTAREAALAARIEASRSFGATNTESQARELLEAERDAKADVEDASQREGEALVRLNAARVKVDRARQARRHEVQSGINREAFVTRVTASGGTVEMAELDRHYPQPGRLVAALRRVGRRVRS